MPRQLLGAAQFSDGAIRFSIHVTAHIKQRQGLDQSQGAVPNFSIVEPAILNSVAVQGGELVITIKYY